MSRTPETLGELADFLPGLVSTGRFSGVTAAVGDGAHILWRASAGLERIRPARAARWTTRWDLASLGKPQIATLALVLDRDRLLPLEARVGDVFRHAAPAMASVTLASLLLHRSGLRAWTPLYARCRGRGEALDLLLSGALRLETAGRSVYSDLGYILWSWVAEEALGESTEDLLRRRVWKPLGMRGCCGPPGAVSGVAEAKLDNSREVKLAAEQGLQVAPLGMPPRGRPQDGNARFLGRVAGHAGLFGSASDMLALGREWLRPDRLLTTAQVSRALDGGGEYALGWARRRVRGTAGPALSRRAFGLVGSTGGSLWIDPERQRVLVLLGHRTSWEDLKPTRRRFHRLAVEALG